MPIGLKCDDDPTQPDLGLGKHSAEGSSPLGTQNNQSGPNAESHA